MFEDKLNKFKYLFEIKPLNFVITKYYLMNTNRKF